MALIGLGDSAAHLIRLGDVVNRSAPLRIKINPDNGH
jgi:hypothetical protein